MENTTIVQPPVANNYQKPLSLTFLILCGLLLATITGVGGYYLGIQSSKNTIQSSNKFVEASPIPSSSAVACTMEAKVCPNGSSVGRIGPNCEFAKCPNEINSDSWVTLNQVGFNIKHPSSFYKEDVKGNITLSDSKSSLDKFYSNQPLNDDQIVIRLLSLSEHFAEDDQQAIANRMSGGALQNVAYTTVKVGGKQAIRTVDKNTVNYGLPTQYGFILISAEPATSSWINVFEAMIGTVELTTPAGLSY